MSTENCPDNQNNPEREDKTDFLEETAWKLCLGIFTDDNYSDINELTGLEQVIAYEYSLNPFREGDIEKIEQIKTEIFNIACGKYLGGYYSRYGEIDLNDYSVSLYEKGDEKYLKNYISRSWTKREYQEWIDEIAISVLKGVLTEDNPSQEYGFSGLEQVIISKTHLNPYFNSEDFLVIEMIMDNVSSRIIDYHGGHSINREPERPLDLEVLWKKE
jgi:hypothetical protein